MFFSEFTMTSLFALEKENCFFVFLPFVFGGQFSNSQPRTFPIVGNPPPHQNQNMGKWKNDCHPHRTHQYDSSLKITLIFWFEYCSYVLFPKFTVRHETQKEKKKPNPIIPISAITFIYLYKQQYSK